MKKSPSIANFIESSDNLYLQLNNVGEVIYHNPAFEQFIPKHLEGHPDFPFSECLDEASQRLWNKRFPKQESTKDLNLVLQSLDCSHLYRFEYSKGSDSYHLVGYNIDEVAALKKQIFESERNYNTTLKHINQGIVYQDTTGAIVNANTAATEILGLTMDQLQGRTSVDPRWKSIHEDGSDYPGEEHPASLVLQSQAPITNKIMGVFHPAKNKTVWIRVDSYPHFNLHDNEFLGVHTYFADITQFKTVKDQSQDNQLLLKQIINSSTEVSFISTDVNGMIQIFNTGAERLLGYSHGEVEYKTTLAAFHDPQELNDRAKEIASTYQVEIQGFDVLSYLPQMLNKGEKRKWLYTHKNGRKIPVEVTCTPVFDSQNHLTGYLAIAVDISQEEATKKWNEDLLNELIRFKEGLDHAALVSMTDPEGRITFANKKFIEVSGYQYEELFLQNHRIVKSNRHPKSHYKNLWDTITSGNIWTGEICNLTKTGEEYWVNSVIVPFKDNQGEITHYLSIRHDITAEKQATLKAIQASKAKSEFLANMSHEIRTPMNGVIGMTDLLLETELDEEQLDLATTVKASAGSLLDIINDILDFSKIEAGKLTIESTAFNLGHVCESVVKVMKFKAEEASLYCNLYLEEDLHPFVNGDPTRLKQILINLMGNAIKFTQKGGVSLKVSQATEMNWVRFEVKDSGIGIADHIIDKLFDKFTQAETSTTRNFGGTGLGLSITKQLVELMGGRIGVKSVIESGSTFWFEIEFPPVQGMIEKEGEKPVSDVNLSQVRILVAEDNRINQKVIAGVLNKFHIKPIFAEHGQECLEKLLFSDYDMIFMDMHMPIMDGETATKEIRSNPELIHLPIIAMTANVMSGFKDHCLDIGMNDYVTKPFTQKTIREVILKWKDYQKEHNGQ